LRKENGMAQKLEAEEYVAKLLWNIAQAFAGET
jgi:hypothetical protein